MVHDLEQAGPSVSDGYATMATQRNKQLRLRTPSPGSSAKFVSPYDESAMPVPPSVLEEDMFSDDDQLGPLKDLMNFESPHRYSSASSASPTISEASPMASSTAMRSGAMFGHNLEPPGNDADEVTMLNKYPDPVFNIPRPRMGAHRSWYAWWKQNLSDWWAIPFLEQVSLLILTIRGLFCLVLCGIVCLPAWTRVIYEYRCDKDVKIIKFSNSSVRHDVAVWGSEPGAKKPVVILVVGGAWMLGWRGWMGILARNLRACGCLVISPDYRNYPGAWIPDMVDDTAMALRFIKENLILQHGGDMSNVNLVGQSAGGVMATIPLLRDADLGFVKSIFYWSAVVDLVSLNKVLGERGLPKMCIRLLCDPSTGDTVNGPMRRLSPLHILSDYPHLITKLPKEIYIWHSKNDRSIPFEQSERFSSFLRHKCKGSQRKVQLLTASKETDYPCHTHAGAVVDGPLCGIDSVFEHITKTVLKLKTNHKCRCYAPEWYAVRMKSFLTKWMPF